MFKNGKRILSILMSVIMIVTSAVSAAVSSGAVEEITAAFESTSKETTGTYYHDDYTSAVHTTAPTTYMPSTDYTTDVPSTYNTTLPPDGFWGLSVEIDRRTKEAIITDCSTSLKGDLVIPDFYRGYPVTTIASFAFHICNIKSITLGRMITKIENNAFSGCDIEYFVVDERNPVFSTDSYGVLFNKDKTILVSYPCGNTRSSYSIPDSVQDFSDNTLSFDYGYYLTDLIIGDGITEINSLPRNLKNLTIGAGVTSINCDLSSFTFSIDNFSVDERNPAFSSDAYGTLFNKDKSTLIRYPNNNSRTEYTIPDTVKTLSTNCFSKCNNLSDITIPNGVTTIEDSAFSECAKITDISIPDSVTSMGAHAFSYCTNLRNIRIGNNIQAIEYYTFNSCNKLENITFGNKISSIGAQAFEYCTALKNINMGDNVSTIDTYAFNHCSSLENVTLSKNITTVRYAAFLDCSQLKSVTIGTDIVTIENAAFGYNSNNTITEGFTIYGYTGTVAEDYANLYDITFISLGTYNPPIQDDELLKYLSYNIVDGEVWITDCDESISGDIVLPDRIYNQPVIGIGESAFQYCTNLRSVKIGRYLTHFSAVAFYGCSGLESFTVNGLNTEFTTDEYGVLFNKDRTVLVKYPNGSSRTSYSIPDSVTELGTQSFSNANNLVNVTFGINVKELLGGVFADCNGIESITLNGQIDIIGSSSFSKCSNLTSVIIGDSVTAIAQGAFAECKKLKNLTFGNNIKIIDMVAFTGCESLTNIIIPDSVTQIGASAFSKCTNLKTVTLGNGIKTIGYNAFGDCTNLENLTLGNSVITIDSEAFNACKNLLSVTIGPQVTTIGENAFGTYYNSATGETELVNGFTIYGYTGTEAEAYAKRYGINFVSLGVIEKEELEIDDSSITVDIDNLIATIIPGKTADEIAAMIKNEKFRIIDIYGNEIHGTSAVGTGSTIQIENADGHITEYTVIVPADIDGNGKTTAADARLALRASARIDVLEDVYALAADVSNDGRVTAMDARTILRIAAGLEKPNIGTESGTEAVAPDFDRLSELITLTFGNSFNPDKADTAYVIDKLILANIFHPAYNAYFSRDSYQSFGEGNKIADPLNKFSSGTGNYIYYSYRKIPAQNVKWICENIYNIEFDMNYTSANGSSYYYDGYIYAFYPQSGSGPWEYKTKIEYSHLLDSGHYEIIASYLESDNFGESFDYETSLIIHAEWKQIDGKYDWVFYSVNELRALY